MRHDFSKLKEKKKFWVAGLVCLLIAAVAGYFLMGGSGKGGKTKKGKNLPQVHVYKAKTGDMMRHVVLSGQTVADATIVLAPKYAGRVTAVNVNLGDEVQEGAVLMVQDTGDLDISILQGEAAAQASSADAVTEAASYNASMARYQAAYDIQKMHYERQQYLYSIGAISQDKLDSAKEEYITSKASYDALAQQNDSDVPASVRSKQLAAQKNAYAVEALRKQRDDMIIRAPRGGIIGYRNVEVGNYLSSGTKVLTIVDNSHVYVDCAMSENDAAIMKTGMQVKVTVDAMGKTFTGKLVYVSPATGESSKSYTARISLDVAKDQIKAGLFARGAIDILQRKDTIAVPKDAVQTKNGETKVFVFNPDDNTVEERKVTIGLLNDKEAEILSGIKDGEIVVTSNLDRLQNGTKVRVKSDEDGDDD